MPKTEIQTQQISEGVHKSIIQWEEEYDVFQTLALVSVSCRKVHLDSFLLLRGQLVSAFLGQKVQGSSKPS